MLPDCVQHGAIVNAVAKIWLELHSPVLPAANSELARREYECEGRLRCTRRGGWHEKTCQLRLRLLTFICVWLPGLWDLRQVLPVLQQRE